MVFYPSQMYSSPMSAVKRGIRVKWENWTSNQPYLRKWRSAPPKILAYEARERTLFLQFLSVSAGTEHQCLC